MKINTDSKILPYVISLGSLTLSTVLINIIGIPAFIALCIFGLVISFWPRDKNNQLKTISLSQSRIVGTKNNKQLITEKSTTKLLTGASK